MAGIYLHIPFCKSRCVYCGFFSTTQMQRRSAYVQALKNELSRRRDYIGTDVSTVYFGGGTPSQLPADDLRSLLSHVCNIYNVENDAEITIEANPDDVSSELLARLRESGFNRLSMGVQTFDDDRLRFLHRRHTADQAERAVALAKQEGFANVSIDLMFGFPGQTLDEWKRDVERAIAQDVQHISAYSLMYEEGTPLMRMLDSGDVSEVDEELSLRMYEHLIDTLASVGFEQYEISNFAKPGHRSRHNSSYWRGVPYLGVGAGAHSFDGHNRHYNPDSLDAYLAGAALEKEELTADMLYDEFVFTGLRTSEGVCLNELEARFGRDRLRYCLDNAKSHIDAGRLCCEGDVLRLTRTGLFVSNDVMSDLMFVE